jgi:hypothetical protein
MSLAEEAQVLACEASTELDGKKSGKFYNNPDWWKDDDSGQEPPSNPRWN